MAEPRGTLLIEMTLLVVRDRQDQFAAVLAHRLLTQVAAVKVHCLFCGRIRINAHVRVEHPYRQNFL